MSRAACIPETLGDRGGGVRALGDGVTPVSETHIFLFRMETFAHAHTHTHKQTGLSNNHTHTRMEQLLLRRRAGLTPE